jgi:hypothetical protein
MNELLQGALINQTIDNNLGLFPGETTPRELIPDEQVIMPEALATFIEGCANTSTPSGDEVRFNLPAAGIPQLPIPADAAAGTPQIGAGSFGVVDANTHNAYEAYVAPIVTAGLVQATIAFNGRPPAPQPWQPLPRGAYPDDAIPNRNMLGWREPEHLNPEALNAINGIHFATHGMAGRLCHSSELLLRVTGILKEKEKEHKMRTGWPGGKPRSPDLSYVVTDVLEAGGELSRAMVSIESPFQMTAPAVARQFLTANRRRRTLDAPGCCYTLDGINPQGWVATRNANFEMAEDQHFGPIACADRPDFRVWRHSAVVPREPRDQVLAAWIRSKFVL